MKAMETRMKMTPECEFCTKIYVVEMGYQMFQKAVTKK